MKNQTEDLERALVEYVEQFVESSDSWAFDERDGFCNDLDEFLKKKGIRIPQKGDRGVALYKRVSKAVDKMLSAAENLAYTYRVAQSHTEIGEAKDRYEEAKGEVESIVIVIPDHQNLSPGR